MMPLKRALSEGLQGVARRDALKGSDEIQLRDAIAEASKADVPAFEVEKAREVLSRSLFRAC